MGKKHLVDMSFSVEELESWASKYEGFRRVISDQDMLHKAYSRWKMLCEKEGISEDVINCVTEEECWEIIKEAIIQGFAPEAVKAWFASKPEQDMLQQTIENPNWVEERVERSIQAGVWAARNASTTNRILEVLEAILS